MARSLALRAVFLSPVAVVHREQTGRVLLCAECNSQPPQADYLRGLLRA
jgi:hypothetical protein